MTIEEKLVSEGYVLNGNRWVKGKSDVEKYTNDGRWFFTPDNSTNPCYGDSFTTVE